MKFSLDRMISIKSEEIPEMRAVIESIKTRKRPHYKIRETLTDKINIITELKHSSPSAGLLQSKLSDVDIVKRYISGGASAISVLTEKNYFNGSYNHLESVSSSCTRPVLCKDFVYFEEQVEAAYLCGADMVLLISRILDRGMIEKLYNSIMNFNMTPRIEIHEIREAENIICLNPEFVLVNMRNLDTLELDFNTGIETLKGLPGSLTRISASGINSKDEISYIFNECGVNNFLVGSSLMTSGEPEKMIREFKNVY